MQMNVDLPQKFEQQLQESVVKVVSDTVETLSRNSKYGEYMDKSQCSAYLNISRSTFDKWLRNYDVPYTLIGGTYRFKRSEIDKFMLSKQK
ncbi:excisionase family DNA-binding protein [Liquorilactobacillus satsumensis]|uniref:excisionase family DNA-binding protein n=1 Tax=Liquorilactobacillus satsumensis TaxID=259059 RepID=UPI0039ED3BF0